jgi:hypothetical protein
MHRQEIRFPEASSIKVHGVFWNILCSLSLPIGRRLAADCY